MKGLKTFSKSKDACPCSFNFHSRWLPAAAAFVGSKAAATAELRVAATAYSGTLGALAASASGVLKVFR